MKRSRNFRQALITSLLIGASHFGTPAWAEAEPSTDSPNPTAAERGDAADIVVTGTRKSRAEALQDVPVAVSAFSAAQIEAMKLRNLSDIGNMTPGARFEASGALPGTANLFVRGVGVTGTNASDDPTVGIFVDGMYLGVAIGALTDFFDLESIEVLRGPQGTLFGRNVTGGAVLIRSRRPSGDFGLRAEGTVGSFSQRDVSVAVEAPIVEGHLNAKIAVMYKDHDGYFSNAFDREKRIGASDLLLIRPMLEWKPTPDFTFTIIGEMGKQRDFGSSTKSQAIRGAAVGVVPPVPTGKFDLTTDFYARNATEWQQVIGEGVWELGNGRLTGMVGYRKLKLDAETDVDATAYPLFHFVSPTGLRQDQRTAEIVYATRLWDRADLTVGANYFDQHFDYIEARSFTNPATGAVAGQVGRGIIDHRSAGVFAQADVDIVAGVTATLGGRYTYERKHGTVSNIGTCNSTATVCAVQTDDSKSWDDFTPKLGLRWQPSHNVTLYGSYTRGFRGGGYNVRNSVGPAGPYDPETVEAYEVGIKTLFFDRRLRTNIALYRNEYSDLQRQVLDDQLRQRIINAASARVQGVELDVNLTPVQGLSLGGTLTYTDGKFLEYLGVDLTGDGVPDPGLTKGLPLARIPKWTYSLYGSYQVPLGDAGSLTFNSAYSYVGARTAGDLNRFPLDPYGLLDASITFESADDRYTIALFGKNLTNKLYGNNITPSGTFQTLYIGRPRTWGVTFGFKY